MQKLTDEERDFFYAKWEKLSKYHTSLRQGQIVMSALYYTNADLYHKILESEESLDCYYDDSKIPGLLKEII